MRPIAARATEDVADAVDLGLQPRLGHTRGKPVSRFDIFGRIGWPVHAGFVGADLRQRAQIAKQAVGIDGFRHGAIAIPCGRISPSGVGVKPETLSDSAHSHFAWYST